MVVVIPSDREREDRQQIAELIRSGKFNTRRFTRNIFAPEEMPEMVAD